MNSRELGQVLLGWRKRARLTAAQLANQLAWHRTKITFMELGTRLPSSADVAAYMASCGATLPQVHEVNRRHHDGEDGYLVRTEAVATLTYHEGRASHMNCMHATLVPGQLQTEDYIRAVMTESGRLSGEQVELRTRERLCRQAVLNSAAEQRFSFYLYEAALRCPMGSARMMHEQMLHLLFAANDPHISIRVVPFESGRRVASVGHLQLLDFEKFGPVAYTEAFKAWVFMEKPQDVGDSRTQFTRVEEDALSETQSRAFLAHMANEYDRPEGAADLGVRAAPRHREEGRPRR